MNFSTIPELYYSVCKKWGNKIAYNYLVGEDWEEITYNDFLIQVECFALGLMDLGIHKGDRIGVISENRLEWLVSVAAISMIGAIDVPLFPNLTSKQEADIFADCQATAIIVSNSYQLNKVLDFKDDISSLRHIIVMNDKIDNKDIYVRRMSEILQRGSTIKTPEERRSLLQNIRAKLNKEDIVTLIYTSGTTGEPKGVMLTHENLIANGVGSKASISLSDKDEVVSFLPLCHCFERMVSAYVVFAAGATITLAPSVETLMPIMQKFQPTFMTVVPKFLDTVKKKIMSAMEKESITKQKIFNWAINVGSKYVRNKLAGKSNPLINTQYNLAYKLVFSKLREKVGENLVQFISGGAALSDGTTEFFEMIGIQCLQGYGLTEASPVVSVCRLGENEIGTIGKPLPNLEVKIAEDGELLIRGASIMKGYWNNEEATNDVLDKDGWLYSGDIATMTERGNLKITDRKKYILVNSGGKNIAPQVIENVISQSKYIEHCVLIGDNREYCTALLTPNYEAIRKLAEGFGIEYNEEEELLNNKKIIAHIKNDIDYLQKDFSKFERIRKFQFLSKVFSIEAGELSPKLSVKRHVVEKKYSELIDLMYGQ